VNNATELLILATAAAVAAGLTIDRVRAADPAAAIWYGTMTAVVAGRLTYRGAAVRRTTRGGP
jgi:hypothetical protein